MESIEECVLSSKILVGVALDAKMAMELLSWAISVVARPNDTVIALHVLVGKDDKKIDVTRVRQAKACVISMLGDFAHTCQNKQVKLEAKIKISSCVAKALVDEASFIDANFLLIGGSRSSSRRKSLEIVRYCFNSAPKGCLVIAIGGEDVPENYTDSESVTWEGSHSSSTRHIRRDSNQGKIMKSKFKTENYSKNSTHDGNESTYEKSSPRGVLDGPEAIKEECSSALSNDISTNGRSKLWRRLSIVKLLLPLFRWSVDESAKQSDECLSYKEEDFRPSWRCFGYEEISLATNDFHPDNIVGRGGYAEVYRGTLSNGQHVAVKRLAKGNVDEHKEKDFLTELGILGHVCHPNTAYLLGWCIDNGLHLIFDFYPNGSLASALHGRNSELLEWPARYKIAVGIARGLHYLHNHCRRRIIHRDIKTSNVLLGPAFEPQICDFGLAKWLPKQWTYHSVIPIEGTLGYLAPEYFMHGIVDEKTDVYAFGVLLLEIVTARKPVDTSKQSLLLWARPLMESGNVAELADPRLERNYDKDQLERLVLIASYCVRQSPVWRPTMSEVLELLMDAHKCSAVENWEMQEQHNDWDEGTMDDDSSACYYQNDSC